MSQADKLCNLLKDGREHRTDEILRVVYGNEHMGIARIGARIADLKNGKHTNGVMCDIPDSRRDRENTKLYCYHINCSFFIAVGGTCEVYAISLLERMVS